MDIYISSLAFSDKSLEEMISISEKEGFCLEFSSGLPFRVDNEDICLSAKIHKTLFHNYFPAPREPFVLNLASKDENIYRKSIEHCINGIKLSKKANSLFFAAHAGFFVDPQPNELGKKINIDNLFDIEFQKNRFIQALEIILKHAKENNIPFYIENNVLTTSNFTNNFIPFLCCEKNDINWLFNFFDQNNFFGLLLDTAHLKVTCKTLNLSIENELDSISNHIKAIHHSDNDGRIDNNKKLFPDYWFLKYIKKHNKIPHILEVKNLSLEEINQQIKILNLYGHN